MWTHGRRSSRSLSILVDKLNMKKGGKKMISATARKQPAKRPALKVVQQRGEDAIPEKTLHRIGTRIHDATVTSPKTVGQRMAARRLELGMTQEQVAHRVIFIPQTGQRAGVKQHLSRNSYCMYEIGSVEPDLQKLEQIAKALQVSPQWLAFGIDERGTVDEMAYDPKKNTFSPVHKWMMSPQWVQEQFGMAPSDLVLFAISEFNDNYKAGDVAIVRRGVEPNANGGDYVFASKGEVRTAHIIRPARSTNYRVFSSDRTKHEELPPSKLMILGRVAGKIENISSS